MPSSTAVDAIGASSSAAPSYIDDDEVTPTGGTERPYEPDSGDTLEVFGTTPFGNAGTNLFNPPQPTGLVLYERLPSGLVRIIWSAGTNFQLDLILRPRENSYEILWSESAVALPAARHLGIGVADSATVMNGADLLLADGAWAVEVVETDGLPEVFLTPLGTETIDAVRAMDPTLQSVLVVERHQSDPVLDAAALAALRAESPLVQILGEDRYREFDARYPGYNQDLALRLSQGGIDIVADYAIYEWAAIALRSHETWLDYAEVFLQPVPRTWWYAVYSRLSADQTLEVFDILRLISLVQGRETELDLSVYNNEAGAQATVTLAESVGFAAVSNLLLGLAQLGIASTDVIQGIADALSELDQAVLQRFAQDRAPQRIRDLLWAQRLGSFRYYPLILALRDLDVAEGDYTLVAESLGLGQAYGVDTTVDDVSGAVAFLSDLTDLDLPALQIAAEARSELRLEAADMLPLYEAAMMWRSWPRLSWRQLVNALVVSVRLSGSQQVLRQFLYEFGQTSIASRDAFLQIRERRSTDWNSSGVDWKTLAAELAMASTPADEVADVPFSTGLERFYGRPLDRDEILAALARVNQDLANNYRFAPVTDPLPATIGDWVASLLALGKNEQEVRALLDQARLQLPSAGFDANVNAPDALALVVVADILNRGVVLPNQIGEMPRVFATLPQEFQPLVLAVVEDEDPRRAPGLFVATTISDPVRTAVREVTAARQAAQSVRAVPAALQAVAP